MIKYKHYDIVIAWMEGKEIQVYSPLAGWLDIEPHLKVLPTFASDYNYRIKPAKLCADAFAVGRAIDSSYHHPEGIPCVLYDGDSVLCTFDSSRGMAQAEAVAALLNDTHSNSNALKRII